jgi:hypothetical protein
MTKSDDSLTLNAHQRIIKQTSDCWADPVTAPWVSNIIWLCNATGSCFLFLSLWLSLHGSNLARSAATRLLTQNVRLPFSTVDAIEAARTDLADFEMVGDLDSVTIK